MADEKNLDQQVRESYKRIQQQNTGVAREYAEGSIQTLRQQVEETRNTLEQLTEQLPEGDLHPFRMVLQEMLDAFTWVTDALDNVEETVTGLDITQYMEDAGRDETTDEDDSGDEDVGEGQAPESPDSESSEEGVRATDAARSRAEELGVDLSGLQGTGLNGIITVKDVAGSRG